MTTSAIYIGDVMHRRRGGPAHGFRVPLYMLLLDLDELPRLDRRLRLFGVGRWRPVTFLDRDHLGGGATPLRDRLRALIEARGGVWPGGAVRLLTHARVFGYVFNPVSFFFCHYPDGGLALVVADVSNTFGERHAYLLDGRCETGAAAGAEGIPAREANGEAARRRWLVKKVFHVSPFKSLDGTYRFSIAPPGERADVRIALTVAGETRFAAWLRLRRRPLGDLGLLHVLVRYPLMTLQVIGAIHWQALRLWWKGARYRERPRYDPAAAEHETRS
jgi:DUF1365 family protein